MCIPKDMHPDLGALSGEGWHTPRLWIYEVGILSYDCNNYRGEAGHINGLLRDHSALDRARLWTH